MANLILLNSLSDHLPSIVLKEIDSANNGKQEKLIQPSQRLLNKSNKLRQSFQMLKKFFTGKSSNKTAENNGECLFGKNSSAGEQIADIEPRSVQVKYFKYNASYKKANRNSEPIIMGSYQLLQPLPFLSNNNRKHLTNDFAIKQEIKEFEKNFGVKLERRNNQIMVSFPFESK